MDYPYVPYDMSKMVRMALPYSVAELDRPQLHALYAIWICLLVDGKRR